nr:uncharacterized protein LOC105863756 isoform X5 [Microcebus murinus]
MMLRRQEDEGQRKGGGSFRDKVGEESKLQWGEQCELRRWGNVPRPGSLAAHGGGVEMDTEDYRSFSCQDSLTLSSQLCKEAKASSQCPRMSHCSSAFRLVGVTEEAIFSYMCRG